VSFYDKEFNIRRKIKYDDCNGLFEGQSQIPKAELGDSKFIHEGDTTNNVLNGASPCKMFVHLLFLL